MIESILLSQEDLSEAVSAVRLVFLAGQYSRIMLAEFECIDNLDNRISHATNTRVSASSTHFQYRLRGLNDDVYQLEGTNRVTTNIWSNNTGNPPSDSRNCWVRYDFGSRRIIKAINMVWGIYNQVHLDENYPTNFDIEISRDGTTFEILKEIRDFEFDVVRWYPAYP